MQPLTPAFIISDFFLVEQKVLYFLCTLNYTKCVHRRKEERMTPKMGRPRIDNPRKNQTKIRTTDEELSKIEFCAKELNVSKTDVILLGVEKVYQEVLKRKK